MVEYASRVASIAIRLHRPLAIAVQLGLVVLANRLAFELRFDGHLPNWAEQAFWQTVPWLVAFRTLAFVPFRLFEGLWRYTSIYDLQMMLAAIVTSSVAFFLLVQTPIGPAVYPRSIFIVDAVLLTLLLGGIRMTRRFYVEFSRGKPGKRVLVLGAGDAGEMIVRDMKSHEWHTYRPIGFIDDNPAKVGSRIHGVPVLGTRHDLPHILKTHRPHEVLIAIPNAEPTAIRAIIRSLEPFKIPIKTLPNLHDIIDGKVEISQIRELSVEDLLSRPAVGLDTAPVKQLIRGRRVMVTGAGGSIGAELCRQIGKFRPSSLVLFERYENSLHAIRMELEDARPSFKVHPVVGDVADTACVGAVLEKHRPEILFHAAAHKHVPLMEENPCEAIKNNVRGTRLLAEVAEKHGVDRFILISTDKAVNPANVMGASKRLAELVVQRQAAGSGTSFSIVRFGNVLGSNGSVLPRFLDQIRKGGPVTVTHPDIRRFFMLIPEAVQLVLHAAAQAESGAIYVLEMGEQVKVLDMARDLIRLAGFVPEDEIPIEFVGLRPGEKLYEELVGRGETLEPSQVDKILRVTSGPQPGSELLYGIRAIEQRAAAGDTAATMALLRRLIPEFGSEPHDVPVSPPAPRVKVEAARLHFIEQQCPSCGSRCVHRSRARTVVERVRRGFRSERLFKCDECGWRGWLLPLEFAAPDGTQPAAAPNLKALDSAVEVLPSPRRPSFAPRNLR